ncbi:hypothetical protein [Paenibacillus polymyxa]|uniref:hypothetical protein n=1 Tax=Paenibacillus polymyxa TaxID=1406 RepID=UPI000737B516|nr:hypothetical protein [Paenibacillus polymyxa]
MTDKPNIQVGDRVNHRCMGKGTVKYIIPRNIGVLFDHSKAGIPIYVDSDSLTKLQKVKGKR